MTTNTVSRSSSPAWLRLLDERTQPSSLRETYDLLADMMTAMALPADVEIDSLEASPARRLGYLVMATRLMTGVRVHPTWRAAERAMPVAADAPTTFVLLFKGEPVSDGHDDLARLWGLARGVDSAKFLQIAETGAC